MLVLAAVASALTGTALTATDAPAAAAAACEPPTFRHSFTGAAGTATITPLRRLCPGQSETFTLAAYTAPAQPGPGGLFVYDVSRATLTPGKQSVTLKVSVPSCFTHVYAVRGTVVPTETTTTAYTGSVLGSPESRSSGPAARHLGGSSPCAVAPAVIFTNRCDRTFTARVSNAATATVPAVVFRNGRLTRIAPGRATTLTAGAGSTLTFRASNFTTYVGTWRSPTTPCTPAATASATATVPALELSPLAGVAPSSTPSSSLPAAAGEPELPALAMPPAASPTATATDSMARAGMSTGSMLAIALGFLLMGGGVVLLMRLIRASRESA
jgi:hypothetical protein